jgi:hypothetical protein
MAACVKHPFDDAVDMCAGCAEAFCDQCLVYVHGPERPPLCVPCALVAAGVRRLTPAERRAHRARQRERARAAATAVRAQPAAPLPGADTEFGPMSPRGRALLEARNGHGGRDDHDGPAPRDADGATLGNGHRRRRFLGLF